MKNESGLQMTEQRDFLAALPRVSQWIFAEERGLVADDFALLPIIKDTELAGVFYYYAKDSLPDEYREYFRLKFQANSMRMLRLDCFWQDVAARLSAAGLRFIPIKGIDLAVRCYPAPGLRYCCDIDVLMPPDDCSKAQRLLCDDNWTASYEHTLNHHLPTMEKNGIALELHFVLPGFNASAMRDFWQSFNDKLLSPELNLLVIFEHTRQHHWENGVRLLLDAAFLLKTQPIDWEKIKAASRKFRLASPELLFWAFPEFFPAQYRPSGMAPDKVVFAFRQLLLQRGASLTFGAESTMSAANRFSRHWWEQRLRGLRPSVVRYKYHIPQRQYGRLFGCYCKDIFYKLRDFVRFLRGDRSISLRNQLKQLETVERFLTDHDADGIAQN